MLKLHTGILFFGKSLQHASEINETLVFWMPPEGPRTPVVFLFFFCRAVLDQNTFESLFVFQHNRPKIKTFELLHYRCVIVASEML